MPLSSGSDVRLNPLVGLLLLTVLITFANSFLDIAVALSSVLAKLDSRKPFILICPISSRFFNFQ